MSPRRRCDVRLSPGERILRLPRFRFRPRRVLPRPAMSPCWPSVCRSDFKVQNLEVNVIRFPICDTCGTGCGCNSGCDGGCGTNYTGCDTCGCDDCWTSNFWRTARAACVLPHNDLRLRHRVRRIRTVPPTTRPPTTASPSTTATNCATTCRSKQPHRAAGRLDDQVLRRLQVELLLQQHVRRVREPHDELPTHVDRRRRHDPLLGSGDTFNVRSAKDDIAFLGELRVGGSYDVTCHARPSWPTGPWRERHRHLDRPDSGSVLGRRRRGRDQFGQLDRNPRRADGRGMPVLKNC